MPASRLPSLFLASPSFSLLRSTSVIALVLATPAHADSVFWNGPSGGSWFVDSHWVWDGHTPGATDNAYINTAAGPLIPLGMSGFAGNLYVGTSSQGVLTVDGTLTTGSALLGNSAGAEGTVTVSGGTWTNSGVLTVGNEGQGSLVVTSGGSASAGTTYLGTGVGGAGSLLVEGGSDFNAAGFLLVGYAGNGGSGGTPGGNGTLSVTDGLVTSIGAVIADGIGATGSATISGSDSDWINAGSLTVGGGGVGSLTILNGGYVFSCCVTTIGQAASSASSSIDIAGTGSFLESSGGLIVGNYGAATLTVGSGATVSSGGGVIGRHSVSTATVTGSGSTWTSGDLLIGGDSSDPLGTAGNGTLNISAGGAVTSTSARLGDVAGASGSATIADNGSKWTITSGNLQVGARGTGNLTIRNGAAVEAVHSIIGTNTGASGEATVTGAGSRWTSSGNLYVGNEGSGVLRIEDGAAVTSAAGYIATLSGSDSSVTVDGAGSSWTMTEAFIAGYSSGTTAMVTLRDGGRISALQGTLGDLAGSTGTMTVTGAGSNWNAFVDSSVAYSGYMNVGRYGKGVLTVSDGGSVTGHRLYIGNETGSSGTVTLTGAGSEVAMASRLFIGAYGNGTLTLSRDAALRASDIVIARGAGVAGTLNIGAASGQSAQAAGAVDASAVTFGDGAGRLVFNHTDTSYVFDAPMSGAGQVLVENGVTTLTGNSGGFTGTTTIEAGTLAVNGKLGGALDVQSAGRLQGIGSVGDTTVRGTVAPGNSIGTLNVNGNVTFRPSSIYEVEIDGSGKSDRIAATGAATINGGTVQILPDQGVRFRADHAYAILTAQSGVSGRFGGILSSDFAFITPTLGYGADAVTLTMVRKTGPRAPLAFRTAAASGNQYRTADAVEALGAGNLLYDTVLGASVAGARQAFDALSGEAHASAATVAYEDSRKVREAVLARLREPLGGPALPLLAQGPYGAAFAADRPGKAPLPAALAPVPAPLRHALWGEGFGSWGKVRSDGNAASLDTSTGGFILGADAQIGDGLRLGLAGGYISTAFDVEARRSSGSNGSVFGALYGSGRWGDLSLRLGAAYAHHDIDLSRTVSAPGLADAVKASYDGATLQAFGEVGYRFALAGLAFEPFAGASVLRLDTDGFQERGGAAVLTGFGRTYELDTTTLGIRAEAQPSPEMPLTVRGLLGWRHAYGDVEPAALVAFAGGASPFSVAGVPVDRDALVVEAGLDWQASDAISLGVSYSGQIGSRAQDHALKGNLVWRFDTR